MSIPAAASDAASAASFHLLGPVTVTVAGRPVRLGGPRQVAVLSRLALSPGQVVSMDQLSDSVWEDDWPSRPEVALRSYISNLRRIIEPDRRAGDRRSLIESVAPGYRLVVDPRSIDANRFEGLVKGGRRAMADADPQEALARFEEALALWRGEPCEGVIESDAIGAFRSRLADLWLVATELSFEVRLGLGEHETVLPDLEIALAEHPLRERFTELAMLALYRSGRQSDALAACQRLRQRLVDSLGVDPGPAIQNLEHQILVHDERLLLAPGPQALMSETGPARAASSRRPPVVGRTNELARLHSVETVLGQGRGVAVLLTGEAGAGKSTMVSLLADRLAAADIEVRWGRSRALARGQVLWPWRQILEGLDAPRAFVDAAEATAAFPTITEILRDRSSLRPLLVVLEDLHWADEATIELLAFAGAALAGHPIAFVATWRPTDLDAPSTRQAMRDLSRVPTADRIELTGLAPAAVAELIDPATPSRRELSEALCAVGGGNPFLIRELMVSQERAVEAAAGGEPLVVEGSSPAVLADLLMRLPPSASTRDMVLARVERTHPQAPTVLSVGALVPGSFRAETVAEAAGLAVEEAERVLEAATEAGLLCDDGPDPGSYRFLHPIAARSIVAHLPGPRLARIHAALGHTRWKLGDDPAGLAFHFARARSTGTSLLAARFALESVTRHGTIGRIVQAEALASEALATMEHLPGATGALEIDLTLLVAQACRLWGMDGRQRQMAERALAVARRLPGTAADAEAVAVLAGTGPHPAGAPFTTLCWAAGPCDPEWVVAMVSRALSRIGPDHPWAPVLELREARAASRLRPLPPPPSAITPDEARPRVEPGPFGRAGDALAGAHWREWLLASEGESRPGDCWEVAQPVLDRPPQAPTPFAPTGHDRLLALRVALADLDSWPEDRSPEDFLDMLVGTVPGAAAEGGGEAAGIDSPQGFGSDSILGFGSLLGFDPDSHPWFDSLPGSGSLPGSDPILGSGSVLSSDSLPGSGSLSGSGSVLSSDSLPGSGSLSGSGSVLGFDIALTSATVAMMRGRLDQAARAVVAQEAWCRDNGIATAGPIDRQRLALLWEQGRFDDLAARAARGLDHRAPGVSPPAADRDALVVWQAVAAGEAGDRALSRELLDQIASRSGSASSWSLAMWCLAALAAHRCEHREVARAAAVRLESRLGTVATDAHGLVVLGPVRYFAGLAAVASGESGRAVLLQHRASAEARRIGAPGWLVRVLVAQAELAALDHDWSLMDNRLGEAKSIVAETGAGWLDGWLSRSGLQSSSNPFATS